MRAIKQGLAYSNTKNIAIKFCIDDYETPYLIKSIRSTQFISILKFNTTCDQNGDMLSDGEQTINSNLII